MVSIGVRRTESKFRFFKISLHNSIAKWVRRHRCLSQNDSRSCTQISHWDAIRIYPIADNHWNLATVEKSFLKWSTGFGAQPSQKCDGHNNPKRWLKHLAWFVALAYWQFQVTRLQSGRGLSPHDLHDRWRFLISARRRYLRPNCWLYALAFVWVTCASFQKSLRFGLHPWNL